MTTPTRTPADRYPTGDPLEMTQVIGEPYETTDERGNPVGIAEHIVAVTGVVDEVGDVFVPGVFADAIRNGPKAKGVSGHDWGTKVSKALEREEWMPGDPRIAARIIPNLPEGKTWPREAGAVYVKAQYNLRTPEGRRAYENAKFFGADENFSVGYKVARDGARKRGGRRYINKLDGWFEWSDVLHGANNLAFGLSVKGLLDSELEYSGGRLVGGGEVKALRYVRDSAFWGLPVGTPIRPGMKPRGPKALRMRRAGEIPDPTAGTTEKKPTGTAADREAPEAPAKTPGEGLFKEPRRQTVRAEQPEGRAAEQVDSMVRRVVDAKVNGKPAPELDETEVDTLLDEGITPNELGDMLRGDEAPWGADGPDEDYVTSVVEGYSEEYQRKAREQRNVGQVGKPAEPVDRDEAIYQARRKAVAANIRGDAMALADALAVLFEGDDQAPDIDVEADRLIDMGDRQATDQIGDYATAAYERSVGDREAAGVSTPEGETEEAHAPDAGAVQEPSSGAGRPVADMSMEKITAELEQQVDDPATRAVLADVLAAPDVDTARQMGRDLARRDPTQAATAQAEAGSVADFARRDKRGYPEVNAGVDKLDAFDEGVAERRSAPTDRDARPDTAPGSEAPDTTEDAAPDEVISADELADGDTAAAAALGLIEADDGELEVTAEVANRQDRVEALLEGGEEAVKAIDDTQLPDTRRDVVDEIALQEEISRRDRERRRARTATTGSDPAAGPEQGPPAAEGAAAAPAEGSEGADTAPAEPGPEKPKTRPGLAGAAEDYADALESGDETAASAARTRLESSLRRSRSESEHAQALRDLLADDAPPDPARLRELAKAMRDDARKRRNEQAKSRRLAKRLERERLRSLLGQIDAEMRTRGLPSVDAGAAGQEEGVISSEDLAAARQLTGQPESETEPDLGQPAAAELEPEPKVTPVAESTGLPLGEWTSLDTLPVRVAGTYYEASINADAGWPGKFTYAFRVAGPDGDTAGIGSGRADSIDDARRFIVGDLGETFNGPAHRGLPPEESLPDAPPEPSATERAETVYRDAQIRRQTRDDINPLTGEQDYTVAPPLADQPAGSPPFVDVNGVREHLATISAEGYGTGGNIQWDTALISPGGGLLAFRQARGGGWVIAHTGSGALVSRTPLGRRDAREVMGMLERVTGPNGRQVDWTVPAREQVIAQLRDGGSSSDIWPTAMASLVAARVDVGDYTSKVVGDARRASGFEYLMAGKFPNWRPTFQHMRRTNSALDDLLRSGRARPSGEDRTPDELADDAATVKVGAGALNLIDLGAPDKAAAVLERRADELEAKYGRGSGPYDITGGASSRGSVLLRRMADDVRTMVNSEPQGVEALAAAKPGDRFIVLDNSPTPGNPQVDPTKSYRAFTVLGRRPSTKYDTSGDVLLEVREDNAPPGPRDTMLVRAMVGRGSREASAVLPQWVNQGAGQRQQPGETGESWVPMAPDSHSARARNTDTRLARLAPGEEPPATFRDAQDRVGLTAREPAIEQAIAAARARIDNQAGEITVAGPPKRQQSRARSTARVGGRAEQPAAIDQRAGSLVSQAVLDVQVANQAAIVGGPIDLADTAPRQGYADITAVRRAWASGTDQTGAPMPGGGDFVRDKAADDSYWKGVKLSPAGHFLVMPNGEVVHADSGGLVTGRGGALPTQATALRYADMLERAVLPASDERREQLDWTGTNPDAMRVMRAANARAQQVGEPGHPARIRARVILDEGLNPRAVKAVLSAQTGWENTRRPQDARLLMLDTAPWGDAFLARDTTPTAGRRNYWLTGKPSGLSFGSKADERKSEELRKLLVWAQAMATPAPYTVADELRRYQRDHDGDTVTFTTQRTGTEGEQHEADLGDIAGKIAEQLEHDADPTRWSESEKLVAAGEGTLQVDSGSVAGTIDRLVSDSDQQFSERDAHLRTIIAEIGAGGIQMHYDTGSRQWVAVLPQHGGARAGMGEGTGPLEIRKPSLYGAAPRGHESDEVLITPDGGLRLTFRMQGDAPDIYSPSIARISIPPGAWSLDDGSKPGEPADREIVT